MKQLMLFDQPNISYLVFFLDVLLFYPEWCCPWLCLSPETGLPDYRSDWCTDVRKKEKSEYLEFIQISKYSNFSKVVFVSQRPNEVGASVEAPNLILLLLHSLFSLHSGIDSILLPSFLSLRWDSSIPFQQPWRRGRRQRRSSIIGR